MGKVAAHFVREETERASMIAWGCTNSLKV